MARKRISKRDAMSARAQKRKRQKTIQLGVIVLGLVMVIASSIWLLKGQRASAALDYNLEDIAYDRPLHAVHEMEGAKLDAIPFLPKADPQPKIEVSERFYDFGSIGPQEVVVKEFVIANLGEAPLTLSRAYTTCGCTTADFTGTVIPPGKVAIMTLTLDAGFHDVRGQTVRRGVIIENNDPRNPQMEIWTQASVRSN